jgi:lipopolysaccharide/colanic/teichoic acid biosynthesis glycosyltransferase
MTRRKSLKHQYQASGDDAAEPTVACGARSSYLLLKSWMDRFCALVAVIVFTPLLLILGALVRRDGHPALFCQTRAGFRGRPFTLLKFRTMRPDVDPYGDSPREGADPRITPIGRFLRETSLDELPQLLNVLRGDMALVGPRPLYLQQMAEWTPRQRCRLLVPPGLTGLAQIHGRGTITIEDKIEYDLQYVQSISLRTDLQILWRTVVGVFGREGIYEVRYSQHAERRQQTGTST